MTPDQSKSMKETMAFGFSIKDIVSLSPITKEHAKERGFHIKLNLSATFAVIVPYTLLNQEKVLEHRSFALSIG